MEGYNYIAVEGPIGAGKSILVDALAEYLGAEKIESPLDDNPFLEKFYRNPEKYAFSTQIYFLMSRYQTVLKLFEIDLFHQAVVSDFVFERDKLYASLVLEPQEFELYCQVERHLNRDLPRPQLVVFLQAPPDMLIREVARRGRPFERKFLAEQFIAQLARAYNDFFFNWSLTPLLVVDRTTVDIRDERRLRTLVEYIVNTRISGCQYYSESTLL